MQSHNFGHLLGFEGRFFCGTIHNSPAKLLFHCRFFPPSLSGPYIYSLCLCGLFSYNVFFSFLKTQLSCLQASRILVRVHPGTFAAALGGASFSLLSSPSASVSVDPTVAAEAIKLLGDLVVLAGAQSLSIIQHVLPLLLHCLQTPAHMPALSQLSSLGATHPGAFRSVIAGVPELDRARLASALQAQSVSSASTPCVTGPGSVAGSIAPAAPTIQLKMDFSAFEKK